MASEPFVNFHQSERINHNVICWHQLFKGWITLSNGWIAIHWIAWFVCLTFIHWISIYPVDSVIQPLNNWGQVVWWCQLSNEGERGGCHVLTAHLARLWVFSVNNLVIDWVSGYFTQLLNLVWGFCANLPRCWSSCLTGQSLSQGVVMRSRISYHNSTEQTKLTPDHLLAAPSFSLQTF